MKKIFNSFFSGREDEDLLHYRLRMGDLGKIHKAVVNGELNKLRKKINFRRWNVNEKDQMGRTPLHLACVLGSINTVQLLVENKCLLNPRDQFKRTPLFKAVQCKYVVCSQFLLEHGADPNLVDIHGFSVLHYAVHDNSPFLAELLINSSANIEAKDKSGRTPLILAAKGNKPAMVELLLKNKANVNAVDNDESFIGNEGDNENMETCTVTVLKMRSALMFAVHHDSPDMVQLLLDHGGDVSCTDCFGQSVSTHAPLYGFPR
ncbi:putative ankyrin repeat domain-containing protein 20A5 [Sorex araneus]|uniref:putative ankyrin repeat domain-containing protein 20A5 n=1 Tax=Sorex araneus TaxID=42254 RepID=UPI002433BB54|nr:putative ankyrin repeat domain-containing protein 20A5 [Sorex araneus]